MLLQKFFGKKRVPLVSSAWLNTVADFINGLNSRSGSVRIDTTASAPSIDIDPYKAAELMRSALSTMVPVRGNYTQVGEGLKWTETGLAIDKKWLAREIVRAFNSPS